MKLSDLSPGDIFQYVDGYEEYLTGTFMRLDESNCYINPIVRKNCVFIVNTATGTVHCHVGYRQVTLISKAKENNMKNSTNTGHFVGWKFGVPIRVLNSNGAEIRHLRYLVHETELCFTTIAENGLQASWLKRNYSYELIPHKYEHGIFSPRYPVCQNKYRVAFCNSSNRMTTLDTTGLKLQPYLNPTAFLTLDGKTIELSTETTARLKEELGV